MKAQVLLTFSMTFIQLACAHSPARTPQAIQGETFSPNGKIQSKSNGLNGESIEGFYICFHKALSLESGSGKEPTPVAPTNNHAELAKGNWCNFWSQANIVIPAGTFVKVTDAGDHMVAWGDGRDNSDKFPAGVSLYCGDNTMTFQINHFYGSLMTQTYDEHFECLPK